MGSGLCKNVDIRISEISDNHLKNRTDRKCIEKRARVEIQMPAKSCNAKEKFSHLSHTKSNIIIESNDKLKQRRFAEELNCSLCAYKGTKLESDANKTPIAWMEECCYDFVDEQESGEELLKEQNLYTICEENGAESVTKEKRSVDTNNETVNVCERKLSEIEFHPFAINDQIGYNSNNNNHTDKIDTVIESHLAGNNETLRKSRSITPIGIERQNSSLESNFGSIDEKSIIDDENEVYDVNEQITSVNVNSQLYCTQAFIDDQYCIQEFSANLMFSAEKTVIEKCGLCHFVANGCHGRWNELDKDVSKLMDTVDKLSSLLTEKEMALNNDTSNEDKSEIKHKEKVIYVRNKKPIGISLQKSSCGRRLIMFKDGRNTYQIEVSNPGENKTKHGDLNDINNSAQSPEILSKSFESNALYEAIDNKRYQHNRQISNKSELRLDSLPQSVDTLEVCDKAAVRLRELSHHLEHGEVPNSVLQKTLQYAAYVLDTVSMDEKRKRPLALNRKTGPVRAPSEPTPNVRARTSSQEKPVENESPKTTQIKTINSSKQWTRRILDEEDELSEVQPDAVPNEVREWLASTFTRSNNAQKRRPEDKPKFRSVANAIRAGIMVDKIYRRLANSAPLHIPSEIAIHLKGADEWCFDVFLLNEACNGQVLKFLSADLLNRYGLIHKFKIPSSNLENFLLHIEQGYVKHSNPYHNNLHAADVTQTVHYTLWSAGLAQWLSDLEIFATLIAAIIHDFQHTGTTNNFHVMSSSDITLIYNDRAVLENFHISAAFKVIREDNSNILVNLSTEEYREFRTLVIDMVLATDMSSHFQQIKTLKNLLAHNEFTIDKPKALSYVLHSSDISHPSKVFKLHHKWTKLLIEEFFRQGDMEKELGLPYSPLCDRNTTLVPQSQIGFIDFIVGPTMEICGDLLDKIIIHINGSQAEVSDKQTQATGDSKLRPKSLTSLRTFQRNNLSLDSGSKSSSSVRSTTSAPLASRSSSASSSRRIITKVDRPWLKYLEENKVNWQEKARIDANAKCNQKSRGSGDTVTAVASPESEL